MRLCTKNTQKVSGKLWKTNIQGGSNMTGHIGLVYTQISPGHI